MSNGAPPIPTQHGEILCAVEGCRRTGRPPEGYSIFICGPHLIKICALLRLQTSQERVYAEAAQ